MNFYQDQMILNEKNNEKSPTIDHSPGLPAGHPSYTRRGGAKEMHQRKKATKTLMHLSPRLRLPQQSFGKLAPFLGPSKGWVSSREYIQHTHGK
jgi:hypothetical protein